MGWIWSDDLVRGLIADEASVPPHVRRWIDTPIAIRLSEDDDPHRLGRLLGLEAASTDHAFVPVTLQASRCACDGEERVTATGSAV